MKLSIVTTLYHSANFIAKFHQRIMSCITKLNYDYEIIFVNDGSPDNSLEIALNLRKLNPKIIVVDLAANSGHHKAMMIGLKEATGDLIFLTDVDLEEPPETLLTLIEAKKNNPDYDVYYGVRKEFNGPSIAKFTSYIFYKIFNKLSEIKLKSGYMASRLMTSNYVNSLTQFHERELFLPGIWELCGYRQLPVPAEKVYEKKTSTYTFRKKLKLAVNAITSFSTVPLNLIFINGLIITVTSFLSIITIILKKVIFGSVSQGWASVITSIFFIGGVIIFSLGIIGIYISKIFTEVKQRPYGIIRKIYK